MNSAERSSRHASTRIDLIAATPHEIAFRSMDLFAFNLRSNNKGIYSRRDKFEGGESARYAQPTLISSLLAWYFNAERLSINGSFKRTHKTTEKSETQSYD